MGKHILTPNLRRELKAPLGTLIAGTVEDATSRLKELIDSVKPKKIISVGDVISESMIKRGLKIDVSIIDNKSMRKPISPLTFKADKTLSLKNPAGTITDESWKVIGEAVNSNGSVKVLVDGEEDLLAVVAVLVAPEGSIVVYGQPNEGAVVIGVTEESKRKMQNIIGRMIYEPEN
jgi:uncharacterized protein (UPF0218 family)